MKKALRIVAVVLFIAVFGLLGTLDRQVDQQLAQASQTQ